MPIAPGMKASGVSRTGPPEAVMIRTLKSGQCRLYSRKINPKTGKRRNLGTFTTRAKAEKHELPGGLDRINPPAGATTSPD